MKSCLARVLLAAAISVASSAALAQTADSTGFVAKPASSALIADLRKGGYVIYMRHGTSDTTRPDRAPQVDLNDCFTQRPLTEEGRALAARIGAKLVELKIPVDDVISSPLCRAKESAAAAFGNKVRIEEGLMYAGNMTSREKHTALVTTRELLSRPVGATGNRVIVGHAPNLADSMGYFIKPEGSIAIFRPRGIDGFEYLATITPTDWANIKP